MKIKLETSDVTVFNTADDTNVSAEDIQNATGTINQNVANAVFNALKNIAGLSIREDQIEVTFDVQHIEVTTDTETYTSQA